MSSQNGTTKLARHIQTLPLCDTHEHLRSEGEYVESGPDILQSLFENYVPADLVVAGAAQSAVDELLDGNNPDLRARFAAIRPAWDMVRHTGYGEAVTAIARDLYGIDELTAESIEAANPKHELLRRGGERLRLLRDVANLDHVQIDDFVRACVPDPAGPDFFLYDISWHNFSSGTPDLPQLAEETGIDVHDLATYRSAMSVVFEQNARVAVAVKSQHAYDRTLRWQARTDGEAARALDAYLQNPEDVSEEERLCLGDWSWARGVELAIENDLPFKLHTGYYAGHSRMPVDYIRGGNLCPMLAAYPDARFVLMHIAYPYSDELVALAKHYPNVYADLCWAWSIDPFSACNFVRQFIHAVPANKLFLFGGDTSWPTAAAAYARQARLWFTRALESEVDDGYLTEAQAIQLATRFMRDNQYACFGIAEKKATLASWPRPAG